jgi:hypothetical protein
MLLQETINTKSHLQFQNAMLITAVAHASYHFIVPIIVVLKRQQVLAIETMYSALLFVAVRSN